MTKTTRSKAPARKPKPPARTPRLLPVVRDLPIDTVTENARLNGAKVDVALKRAITGIERELTIDGANILSLGLEDDGWEILRSPLLEGPVALNLGDEGQWRWDRTRDTGGISVQGTASTLRLWCVGSAALRAQTAPVTKDGAKMNIAGWAAWLARERGVRDQVPGLRTVVPRPGEAPPAGTTTESSSTTRRTSGTSKGFSNPPKSIQSVHGRIEMTASRLKIADQILSVADRKNAGPKSTLAMVMAAIVESKLSNPKTITDPRSTSLGTFQAQYGLSMGPKGTITKAQATDVEYCAEAFLAEPGFSSRGGAIKLAKANPSWTAGHVAWMVEQPAAQYRDRYERSRAGAEALIKAWGGGSGGSSGGGSSAVVQPAQWRRGIEGKPESSWTCLDRYARLMGRRRFIALPTSPRPRLVVAADQALLLAAPHLELFGLDDPILQEMPSIELEGIKRLQTIELVAFAHRWSAPPGAVVDVRESGPVNGPWLVQRLAQNGGDPLVRVTLQQPTTRVEQAATSSTAGKSSTTSSASSGKITTTGGAKGIVQQAYDICRDAGGSTVYVGSGYRAGATTSSGNPSDHASNNATQAARDIGKRGINLLTGPPAPEIDRAAAALGAAFGRSYGDGRRTIIDTFIWRGYRVQIIWRTPEYGGHMGHIHVGVRRA